MFDAMEMFDILFNAYGAQGWWPFTLSGEAGPTYNGLAPNPGQKFEVAVGAVLTQNTSWKNVEKAITNMHASKAMSPEAVCSIAPESLHELIRPSGYFRVKAVRLAALAVWWVESVDADGNLKTLGLEEARTSILSVSGVGPETADSILLYAFGFATFVVDAYTKRIFSRRVGTDIDIRYEKLRARLMKSVPSNVEKYKEFHALLVRHAKEHCAKRSPKCADCPLSNQRGGSCRLV